MNSESSWTSVRLGDVAKVISGFAFRSTDFQDSGVPVIKIANIRVGHVDLSETEKVKPTFLSLDDKYHVRRGDILISLTGSHLTQPGSVVGRVALFRDSVRHCLLNQRAGKVIVRERRSCDAGFLFYLLSDPTRMYQIAMLAHGAASQANVSPTQVESLDLRLPPFRLQCRIASVLSAYDNLIENNTRRIKILEEIAQMIYREWFVNFRFPSHSEVEIVESELGQMPKDWKVGTVSNLVRVSREGITPEHFGEETFSHFSIPAFDQGCMPLPEKGKTIKSNKYMVVPGCVLLSKLNPRIPRIWIPVVEGPRRAIASTEFLVLIPASADARNYFFQLLRSDEFRGQFTSLSLGTSTSHQRVKPDDFALMPICLPPPQLVTSFGSVIEPMLRQTEALRKKNANLRETRDFLLPKLISGEVSVEQFEVEAVAQGV